MQSSAAFFDFASILSETGDGFLEMMLRSRLGLAA
jgi:hypothetical protein